MTERALVKRADAQTAALSVVGYSLGGSIGAMLGSAIESKITKQPAPGVISIGGAVGALAGLFAVHHMLG